MNKKQRKRVKKWRATKDERIKNLRRLERAKSILKDGLSNGPTEWVKKATVPKGRTSVRFGSIKVEWGKPLEDSDIQYYEVELTQVHNTYLSRVRPCRKVDDTHDILDFWRSARCNYQRGGK